MWLIVGNDFIKNVDALIAYTDLEIGPAHQFIDLILRLFTERATQRPTFVLGKDLLYCRRRCRWFWSRGFDTAAILPLLWQGHDGNSAYCLYNTLCKKA